MTTTIELKDLASRIGQTVGTSDWRTLDQQAIDAFADVTADRQWIHVDPARAAVGPFGTTIAHGYLTLACCADFLAQCLDVRGARMAINYGLDRVRFPAPVPAGARVRGHAEIVAVEDFDGGTQAIVRVTVESSESPKPACVADIVVRYLV